MTVQSALSKRKTKKIKRTSADENDSGSGKVTERDFTSSFLPFATFAKRFFQREAALGGAFPPRGAVQRNSFILDGLADAADLYESEGETGFKQILHNIAIKDSIQFNNLMTFVRPLFLLEIHLSNNCLPIVIGYVW